MPKIKLEHIVSCSSEDPDHAVNNLLNSEAKKKWKSKSTGESSASVIFQLEKSSKISGIDIGNENSSFVEVLVGRSSSHEQDYKILLAMSSFMTPMEARNLTNNNRVRMFSYNDLASSVRDEKWDRVKVVCTQPFNKHVQFGLSFITLNTPQEQKSEDTPTVIGKFTLRPESPNVLTAGSLFAKRKELTEQKNCDNNVTVAQAIKTSDKPICKPVNIQPSGSSNSKFSDAEERNRNRRALFYDSDEEEENERIDKVVENAKAEEEKKKAEKKTSNKPSARKKNEDTKNISPKPNRSTKKEKKVVTDTPSTSKRKIDTTSKVTNKKRKVVTKPFNELLGGVVFTISGIVNPERANLRTLALSMGAIYRPDWDKTCTHLMCAFANTPKFNQVKGKGKIVTKSWIKDCFDQRKRLPWRRYALDRNDQGKPESEDEIEEAVDEAEKIHSPVDLLNNNDTSDKEKSKLSEQSKLSNPSDYLSGSDTDDEIEKILAKQKKNQATNNLNNSNKDDQSTNNLNNSNKDDQSTNNLNSSNKDDPFNIDTEEEELKKKPANIEDIPQIFKSEIFYIDDVFDDVEKNKIQRLIKAFDGVVLTSLRNIVDFVITNEDSVEAIKDRCSGAKCVSRTWIYECQDILKRIPYENFLLDSV